MSLSGDRLARAEARSELARDRFMATASRLRARLRPRRLLDDAVTELRHASETGAERAGRHPLAMLGLASLLALPIVRKLRRKRKPADHRKSSEPSGAKSPRARKS